MKRLVLLGLFVLAATLPGCLCSNPPPVGPVEDENEVTAAYAPAVMTAAVSLTAS